MVSQPRSLVHGSFRPQNILVERGSERPRVAAIDWELAAFGAPLYDFAFLSDGFQGDRLELLWETYGTEAAALGAAIAPARDERQRVADCFLWHKTLKSLGDSVRLKFDEKTVLKLLGAAAELGDRVFS
jgi:aminoglycoside/choline kinase family phosphotransferase